MARSEARIYCDIWDDEDFVAQSAMEQRAYMFLLSQSDLAHNGVIALRVRRWARKSRGLDAAQLQEHLQALQEGHFVIIDIDTEELLVRALIRRDRTFKQPNVMRAAVDHTRLVESRKILAALADEVARIRRDNPDLTREQSSALSEMEKVLAERGVAQPAASPERPAGNPPIKGCLNGSAIPSTIPTVIPFGIPTPEVPGERGGSETVTTDSPIPVPRSPGTPALVSLASGSARIKRSAPKRRIPEDFAVTEEMVRWAREHTPAVGAHETDQFRDWHVGQGTTKADWTAAWRTWMRKAHAEAEQRRARASPVGPPVHGPGHQLFRPEDHD